MKISRLIPLLVIAALMLLVFLFDLAQYLSFEEMKRHRSTIKALVDTKPILAPLAYIIIYAISTALSIPGAIFLTIFGGFLFPQPFATIYVVIGATIGAIAIFLAARTALGDILRRKAGPLMNKMQDGFQENAASYLLFLRLVPLFPFWLVNLAPAFFGVSFLTFAWTTFIGIIPGAFVFAQAGAGLGAIFDTDESLSINTILNTQVKIALLALGIFVLIPVVIKKLRKSSS